MDGSLMDDVYERIFLSTIFHFEKANWIHEKFLTYEKSSPKSFFSYIHWTKSILHWKIHFSHSPLSSSMLTWLKGSLSQLYKVRFASWCLKWFDKIFSLLGKLKNDSGAFLLKLYSTYTFSVYSFSRIVRYKIAFPTINQCLSNSY